MFVFTTLLFLFGLAPAGTVFVSNLDVTCLQCLCIAATDCNLKYDCSPQGFCGPFFISRVYWEKAGSITRSPNKASSLDGGYMDCVKNFQCASKVVANYMAEDAWDCDANGVTDCDDYARIHFYGPEKCDMSNFENTNFFSNYSKCRPPKVSSDFLPLGKK